jgi:hypothetical protein
MSATTGLLSARRLVPIALTGGLLWYFFATTDLVAFKTALQSADVAKFVVRLFVMAAVVLSWDGVCYGWLLRRFTAPTSWWEATRLRGASWLLNVVNYAAANAMVVAYLKQTKGVGLGKGGSAMIFLMLVDVYALAIVATLGAVVMLPEQAPAFLATDAVLAALMIGHLLYWRRGWSFGPVEKARNLNIFAAFKEATLVDYAILWGLRLPMIGLFVVFNAMLLPCFGLEIPFAGVAAFSPIVSFVTALPISIAGFGTHQVATRELFGTVLGNPLPLVDAFSLATLVGVTIVRLLYGSVLYALMVRSLGRNEKASS